jgi:prophage antirepressor-like protein
MNTALQTFQFQSHQLTVITDESGESWFIAMEVAEILEYSDANKMTSKLDEDEVQNRQIGGFGNRGVNIINESGLWSSVLRSTKPEAKTVKKWLTSEVLPAIHKTGSYGLANPSKGMLDMQNRLLDSQSAQIAYLQEQLAHSQSLAKGMQNIYNEEEAKVQRLLRARGKVKILERRDIFDMLDNDWEVPQIAKWLYRSNDFVKAVIKHGRHAQ